MDGHQEFLERELGHRLSHQALLSAFGLFAVQNRDLDVVLQEACRLTAAALGTRFAKVLRHQADQNNLLVIAGVGWREGVVGHATIPAGFDSPAGYALKTGKPVMSDDGARETRFKLPELLREHGITRMINVIIRGQGAPFGVLEVDSSQQVRSFSAHDVDFLQTAANVLAAAIEREQADALLREATERLRLALETGQLGTWQIELPSWTMTCSDLCKANFGRLPEDPLGYDDFFAAIHPADRARVEELVQRTIADHGDYAAEYRIIRPDGTERVINSRGHTVLDEAGIVQRVIGVTLDITDRVAVAAELARHRDHLEELVEARTHELARSETERRRAQAMLHQVQKIEVVGQMTGGVAHDFNNLLTAIMGSLELLQRRTADPAQLKLLRGANHAAERGAKLANQLLAFARRQALRPETLDVNGLIRDFHGLLTRAAGETVALEIRLQPQPLMCDLDPGQFEAAILNLTVNARDAMPDGGTLLIRTEAVELDQAALAETVTAKPGRYIAISVTDSGGGMAPETIERAFEPFFTTKEVGKGTGLGLSQVYGFVTQSGGRIAIESALGRGTTVRIWLPCSAAAETPVRAADSGFDPSLRGRETILVVEDDQDVLEIAVHTLNELGYQVVVARDGPQALNILNSGIAIDLLFSDIVMPSRMSGAELGRQALRLRPDLRILLTSGYSAQSLADDLGRDFPLMPKPYRPYELGRRIRALLDGTD